MAHALRYYKNIILEDGKRIRIEFHEKGGTAEAMELGDVIQTLCLDIQGGGDIDEPIVKTMLNFTLVDAPDHPDAKTKKCGSWEEFYSPDATHWKVLLLCKYSGETSYTQFWGGYITPDSYREPLTYRGGVSFIARDNIGHLQDFPFDAPGNADGMISLYELLTSAWEKIESPMELVAKVDGKAEWLKCEGSNALYTYMNVSAFEGKTWLDAVTEALYGYGLVMRYVGDNLVWVYPLRNLPVFPFGGNGLDVVFQAGAERELSPAVRRIEETVDYQLRETLPQPLVNNKKDFNGEVETLDFTMDSLSYSVNYWTLYKSAKGAGWINGDSLPAYFNPLGYALATNVDEKDLQYMWFASAYYRDVADDGRAIEYSRIVEASSLNIEVQLGWTHTLENNVLTRTKYNALLFGCSITYVVSIEQNGITNYLDSSGEWKAQKKLITATNNKDILSIEVPQGDFTGEVILSFKIVDIRGAWGAMYVPIYSVTYTTTNAPLLSVNRINTNYNEHNNVILSRSPKIAPAMDKTFMQGVINNGIFSRNGNRYYPAKLWSWNADGTGAQQMAVYNHLQLLCYHAKPNNILSGTILNADVTNHAMVYRWKGTEHLLVSGTLNLISGYIENAVLREFTRYEDMWGDITDTADLPQVEGASTNNVDSGTQSAQAATYSNTTEINIGGGGTIILDEFMSDNSTNGVQNKVIKAYVDSQNESQTTSIKTFVNEENTKQTTSIRSYIDTKDGEIGASVSALVDKLAKMWQLSADETQIIATKDVIIKKNAVVYGDMASGGEGQHTPSEGLDLEELKDFLDENEYITLTDLNAQNYATKTYVTNITNTKADKEDVQALQKGKADKTEIPTKVSQLTNDSGFITQNSLTTIINALNTLTAWYNAISPYVVIENGKVRIKTDLLVDGSAASKE